MTASPRRVVPRRVALVVLVCLFALPVNGPAHPLTFTATELVLTADGSFTVEMVCDLDALALGAPQESDDRALVAALRAMSADELERRVEQLRELFRRRVRVRFDGEPADFDVAFTDHGTPRATDAEIPSVLGLTARLTGAVPPSATTLEFFASRTFSDVHLTIVDQPRGVTRRSILERGARSDPFELGGPVETPSGLVVATDYFRLGLVHIVPRGLDHILFVLGLFLLSTHLRPLVWQVTAFTLAHALTLTLSSLEIVSVSPSVVEPLIALSIVYVAVENVLTARLMVWRPVVVFGFGLLHGLGFAQVLGALGLPAQDRMLALVAFNLGIEVGQLVVIAAAACTIGWFGSRVWYRRRVVVPLSSLIAVVGLVWTLERLISLGSP